MVFFVVFASNCLEFWLYGLADKLPVYGSGSDAAYATANTDAESEITVINAADARKNFLIIFNVLRLIKIIYVNRPPPINNNFHLSNLLVIFKLI